MKTRMIEITVAELEGAALDYAIACCLEEYEVHELFGVNMVGEVDPGVNFRPSIDWNQGGPLLEKYRPIIVYHEGAGRTPMVTMPSTHPACESGDTVLIAMCRAIVAARLGEVVSVPAELVGGVPWSPA